MQTNNVGVLDAQNPIGYYSGVKDEINPKGAIKVSRFNRKLAYLLSSQIPTSSAYHFTELVQHHPQNQHHHRHSTSTIRSRRRHRLRYPVRAIHHMPLRCLRPTTAAWVSIQHIHHIPTQRQLCWHQMGCRKLRRLLLARYHSPRRCRRQSPHVRGMDISIMLYHRMSEHRL